MKKTNADVDPAFVFKMYLKIPMSIKCLFKMGVVQFNRETARYELNENKLT